MTHDKPWQYCAGIHCSIRSPDREARARWMRELVTIGVIVAVMLALIMVFGGMAMVNLQNMRGG